MGLWWTVCLAKWCISWLSLYLYRGAIGEHNGLLIIRPRHVKYSSVVDSEEHVSAQRRLLALNLLPEDTGGEAQVDMCTAFSLKFVEK